MKNKTLNSYIGRFGECPEYGIYLASLSDYNNGLLIGQWYDIEKYDSYNDILADFIIYLNTLNQIDPTNFREEWDVHDTAGLGNHYYSDDIDMIIKALKEDISIDAFISYLDRFGSGSIDDFNDKYLGEWGSIKEYAEDYIESTGLLESIPETLRYYFDYGAYARDLEYSGDVSFDNGYVFSCH